MKKIKGLLLFGILALLGFCSSFGYEYTFNSVEYHTIDNQYSNYIFGGGSTFSFNNANYGQFSPISQILRYNSSTLDDSILNFSNYSLTGSYSLSRISSHLFVNNSSVSLLYKSSLSSYGSYLFRLSSGVDSVSSLFSEKSSNFIRIDCGLDGILVDNIFNSSAPCQSSRTFVFTSGNVYDSSRGVVNDLTFDSVDYTRGSISPGVGDEYSFAFSPSISTSGSVAEIDPTSVPYYFATVSPSLDGNWSVYDGLFILKLDTLYKKSNTGDFRILAIALTGSSINENTLDFIYSRYSCSSNSFTFSQCSFIDGGYLRPSNLTNSFTSYNGVLYNLTGYYSTSSSARYRLFENLLYFLTTSSSNLQGNLSPVIYSIESSNIIQLYRPFFNTAGSFTNVNFSLGLSSSEGINIFDYIDLGGGGGNQSIGSQPVSSLYYSCLGPTYNTPDGRPPIYCFDSSGNFNADRLRNCFADVIATGGELQSSIFCNIDGFTQSVVFTGDGSGVSITPCTSDSCYSYLVVGQSYINLNPVNNVTTGLVLDMITNLTGWVGRCPFPYVDFGFGNAFKLFSYFKSLGYNIDLFIPFNCAVAGFHAGRYSIFDDLDLTIFDIPLLNGDTDKHKILFRFFDVLIIFAIFGIFRFFRKHI